MSITHGTCRHGSEVGDVPAQISTATRAALRQAAYWRVCDAASAIGPDHFREDHGAEVGDGFGPDHSYEVGDGLAQLVGQRAKLEQAFALLDRLSGHGPVAADDVRQVVVEALTETTWDLAQLVDALKTTDDAGCAGGLLDRIAAKSSVARELHALGAGAGCARGLLDRIAPA